MSGDSTTLENFHLDRGGPFHRLIGATRFGAPRRRAAVAVAFTWLPMMGFELAAVLTHGAREPIVRDLSVHARLLIALPLFVVAEQILDRLGHETVTRLRTEAFLRPPDLARFADVLRRAERLRDAWLPELVLAAAALFIGAGALLGAFAPSGFVHGLDPGREFTPARIWYTLVGLPLFQFFMWRLFWRWAIWIFVMAGLSKFELVLEAAHPDRLGGLAFVRRPLIGFCVVLEFAASCVICAGWATEIQQRGAQISSFLPMFYLVVIGGVAIACAPLLLFTPQLVRARIRGLELYSALGTDAARSFRRRWIARKEGQEPSLLDENDACALIDYSSVFRDTIDKFRVLLVGVRDLVLLVAATALPTIPVLLLKTPPAALIEKLGRILIGIRS